MAPATKRGLPSSAVTRSAAARASLAPSSTRMRSRARARRAVRLGETGTVMGSRGFLGATGTNPEQMADGEHEIRAVHGVEVKGVDAVLCQFLHLTGGHRCRDQLAGF